MIILYVVTYKTLRGFECGGGMGDACRHPWRLFALQESRGRGASTGGRRIVSQFFIARRHALAGCKVMVHLYYEYSCPPAEAQGGY